MPIINRAPTTIENDNEHCKVLVKRQTKNDKKYHTVAVQREDSDRWTLGRIVGKGDYNHNNQSYIRQLTKTGKTITRNSRHIKATLITAKQYL